MGSSTMKAKCLNFLVLKFALQKSLFFLGVWRGQQNLDRMEFCQGKRMDLICGFNFSESSIAMNDREKKKDPGELHLTKSTIVSNYSG